MEKDYIRIEKLGIVAEIMSVNRLPSLKAAFNFKKPHTYIYDP